MGSQGMGSQNVRSQECGISGAWDLMSMESQACPEDTDIDIAVDVAIIIWEH